MVLRFGIKQMRGDDRLDNTLQDAFPKGLGADACRVLSGNNYCVNAHGFRAIIFDRHLRFAVRTHEIQNSFASGFRQAQAKLVRGHDRKRHQFGRFVARIAEHQALIACPTRVHALADVRTLARQFDGHLAIVRSEAAVRIGVADSQYRFTDNLFHIGLGGGRNLARDPDVLVFYHRLASYPAAWIGGQHAVKNRVGNLIADFVGMPFGDRFGGKQIVALRLAQTEPPSSIKNSILNANTQLNTRKLKLSIVPKDIVPRDRWE